MNSYKYTIFKNRIMNKLKISGQEEIKFADNQIMGLSVSKMVRNEFLLFKSKVFWYSGPSSLGHMTFHFIFYPFT